MLTDALKAMVNNPFKESFYGKKRKEKKRKAINVLTTFFISHKSGVKTSLKLIVNHCPKRTCQHDPKKKKKSLVKNKLECEKSKQ